MTTEKVDIKSNRETAKEINNFMASIFETLANE